MIKIFAKIIFINFVLVFLLSSTWVFSATSSQTIKIQVVQPSLPPSPPVVSGGGGGIIYLPPPARPPLPPRLLKTPDFSNDGKINIIDLSIMLFYVGKSRPEIEPYDLNSDGKIDLVDISILMYYWS